MLVNYWKQSLLIERTVVYAHKCAYGCSTKRTIPGFQLRQWERYHDRTMAGSHMFRSVLVHSSKEGKPQVVA
jgi:hypothetical protein